MTVTVHTAQSSSLGITHGQNRVGFRNPRGNKNYYVLYREGGNLLQEYSTNGVLWNNTPQTPTSFFGSPRCWDVKIRDDGSQLEVWVAVAGHATPDYVTRYIYGTISDSADDISWSAAQTIDSNITTEIIASHCIALARTDNGRIVIAFTEDYNTMGKDYRQIKLIGSDGDGAAPSWSGEITWDDPSTDTNNQAKGEVWFGLENYDSSYPNRCFLYARVPTADNAVSYNVVTAVPDWNGTAFSNTTQSITWGTSAITSGTGSVLSGLIDESDIAHIVYFNYDTTYEIAHRKAGTAGDDNLSSKTAVIVGIIDALTLTLDTGPATDLLYVFYHDSVDSVDWNYKTSPVGTISWSSEKTVSYHQDITDLSSWNRVVENSLHIMGEYYDAVGYIVYNEHPVYKALSTTLADLEFPDQNYYLGPHST